MRNLHIHIIHHGTPTLRVPTLKDPEFQANVAAFVKAQRCDVVLCHLSPILPKEVLQAISVPIVNFHPGQIPHNGGAMPHYSCFLMQKQGTFQLHTIHLAEEALDQGKIIAERTIGPMDTYNACDAVQARTESIPWIVQTLAKWDLQAVEGYDAKPKITSLLTVLRRHDEIAQTGRIGLRPKHLHDLAVRCACVSVYSGVSGVRGGYT
jgi:folate-dependent phosphoribosylglycinamide formyltransferase PurN